MNKLEMAHDYFMKHVNSKEYGSVTDEDLVLWAWEYADAMQKEWDERNGAATEAILNSTNSSQLEWQPDWSQAAPEWANHLVMTLAGTSYWFESTPWISGNGWIAKGKSQLAFCDMYHKGDWRESLRSRP